MSESSGTVHLEWGASSDTGLRRAVNEDAYLAEAPIFLVADGMGGHEAGAVASGRAIDGFRALVGREIVTVDDVQDAFAEAARSVRSIATRVSAAGTTLSGIAVCEQVGEPYWMVLNIGDSRTYRLLDGRLEQISIDHSAVQSLIDAGEIDAAEAERHPQRNVVTRAVGGGSTGVPDYWLLPMAPGDRMMICSDGLNKEVGFDDIHRVLMEESDAQAAAERLVEAALRRGGKDNVTVVVVDSSFVGEFDVNESTVPRVPVRPHMSPRHAGEGTSDVVI